MRTTAILSLLAAAALMTGCMMPNRDEQVKHNEEKLAAEGYRQLEVGKPAPPVDITAVDGSVILSSPLPPPGPVLLFFITAVDTPNSAKEAHILNAAAAELAAAGVTAAIVLAADPQRAAQYGEKQCPQLRVVADTDLALSIAFGCAAPDAQYLQRTQIGVAADGTIAFFERGFPLRTSKAMLDAFGIAAPADTAPAK